MIEMNQIAKLLDLDPREEEELFTIREELQEIVTKLDNHADGTEVLSDRALSILRADAIALTGDKTALFMVLLEKMGSDTNLAKLAGWENNDS